MIQGELSLAIRKNLTLFALCSLTFFGCKRGDALHKAWLELYSGYAVTGENGMLVGRVHRGEPPAAPKPGENAIKRLEETMDALESNPVANAQIVATVGDRVLPRFSTNERGYIDFGELTGYAPPLVHVRLDLHDNRYEPATVEGDIPVYDSKEGLAIISDIDDTLLDSDVTHKRKMLANAALRSTWDLVAFPDASAVLSEKAQGLPVFYISGSPWGFQQRIGGYFDRNGFPKGPLLLKRFSSDPTFDQMQYKWGHISRVLKVLPNKRWLLFGDSGEKDPEIYDRMRKEKDEKGAAFAHVEKIFIHLVTDEDPHAARFSDMTVFRDWKELRELEKKPQ